MNEFKLAVIQIILMVGGATCSNIMNAGYDVLAFFILMPFSFGAYFLHAKWYKEK